MNWLTKKPPIALINDSLGDCFGRCEMEIAAREIVRRAIEANTWTITLDRTMFIGLENAEYALDGFDDLIDYGWLERTHGDHWKIIPDFVKRLMRKRPQHFQENL